MFLFRKDQEVSLDTRVIVLKNKKNIFRQDLKKKIKENFQTSVVEKNPGKFFR